jgi:REP element-mobilizing transposase RayT
LVTAAAASCIIFLFVNQNPFTNYRRNLPHWRWTSATYFVTWRLHRCQRRLTGAERDIMTDALQHFDHYRYSLLAFVVMDDHVHVLLAPTDGCPLARITQGWKSYVAHRLCSESGRLAPVWQEESYDRVVRDEDELMATARYVFNNPRRRWPGVHRYTWMGGWLAESVEAAVPAARAGETPTPT